MHHLANFSRQFKAQQFATFLQHEDISCELRQFATDDDWELWIHREDQLDAARVHYAAFCDQPQHPAHQFAPSPTLPPKTSRRRAPRRAIRRYRLDIPITLGLLAISAVVFLLRYTDYGLWVYSGLLISHGAHLQLVFGGEVWRLLTPIFLHFGLLHLLFNGLWIYQLGSAVETAESSTFLVQLVVAVGVLSNLAEFAFSGPNFGGLSGVVYGLFGYIWMQSRRPRSAYFIDNGLVAFMLAWLVVCFTGWLGPIANFAHLGGLLVGMGWGLVKPR